MAAREYTIKDITGQRFGLLTVLRVADKPSGLYRWECRCDCGGTKLVYAHNLKSGNTQSCGCRARKKASEICIKRNPEFDPSQPTYADTRTEETKVKRLPLTLPDQVACASSRCGHRLFKPLRRNNVYCSALCKRYEQTLKFRAKHGRGKSGFVPGATLTCLNTSCGREFIQTSSSQRCCSKACAQCYSTTEWRKGNPNYTANRHNEIRRQVFTHYSNGKIACMCPGCTVTDIRFLCIDHIDNNGAADRRSLPASKRGGIGLYRHLIKSGFPPGYQTLCHNCNAAKEFSGGCPHQETVKCEAVTTEDDTMKPGKYYIGDLCYVMEQQWDEVHNIRFSGDTPKNGKFRLESGISFASYSTHHGDGIYDDQHGNQYGVDSGMIGCVRIEDINDPPVMEEDSLWSLTGQELGHVHIFDRPFKTGSTTNGTIYFGDVRIQTGWD